MKHTLAGYMLTGRFSSFKISYHPVNKYFGFGLNNLSDCELHLSELRIGRIKNRTTFLAEAGRGTIRFYRNAELVLRLTSVTQAL